MRICDIRESNHEFYDFIFQSQRFVCLFRVAQGSWHKIRIVLQNSLTSYIIFMIIIYASIPLYIYKLFNSKSSHNAIMNWIAYIYKG